MNRLYSTFTSIRETITPVPTGPSTFRETGNITVDEFVEAGDYLVNKFLTWNWYRPIPPRSTVRLTHFTGSLVPQIDEKTFYPLENNIW